MPEREITIETPDGPMRCFIVAPDGDGPFPVVVQLMDASGIREDLQNIARRYSEAGVMVVLPDLYHRFGEAISFDENEMLVEGGEAKLAEMLELIERLTDEMIHRDVQAVLEAVSSDPLASNGAKGCVGYCLGGRAVIRSMVQFDDVFVCGSALHPSEIVTEEPDSPHLDIPRIKGEIYLGLGGADFMMSAQAAEVIRQQVADTDVLGTVELTPGAQHGFVFRNVPANYHPEADRLHYEHTLDLFARHLTA